jgi:hypothetical protein
MKRLIAPMLFLAIISCSGETQNSRSIENQSGKDLKMVIFQNGFSNMDTLVLEAGSSATISRGTSNRAEEEAPDCAERTDSARTEVVGGGTLVKNIGLSSNWEVESEQTKTVPREFEHTCRFIIRDSDIEE